MKKKKIHKKKKKNRKQCPNNPYMDTGLIQQT